MLHVHQPARAGYPPARALHHPAPNARVATATVVPVASVAGTTTTPRFRATTMSKQQTDLYAVLGLFQDAIKTQISHTQRDAGVCRRT
jgi:hypothetical protein